MNTQRGLTSIEEFRGLFGSDDFLVITDTIQRTATFHVDPEGCSHVQERSFEQKVVENRGLNGSYHRVGSFQAAKGRWPHLRVCRSSAYSAADRDRLGSGRLAP